MEQEGARSGPRARCARSGHGIHQFHLQAIFFFKKKFTSKLVCPLSVRAGILFCMLCCAMLFCSTAGFLLDSLHTAVLSIADKGKCLQRDAP